MTETLVLARRAVVEGVRSPESLMPIFFIPLFFFVVSIGQASKIFPSGDTPFLEGPAYAAFSLPTALLTAALFGTAALFLVEEIEGGYFDKLRATPVPMEAARSLILEGFEADVLRTRAAVLAVGMVLAVTLNVRAINNDD